MTTAEDEASRSLIRAKLRAILDGLDGAFAEREREVRLVLLALLSGHHVLLLGPPGTGKSLLARAACRGFASAGDGVEGGGGARYFEYLLTRFSHPDELFGPISIPGLKDEDYRRLTDGYLPRAEIAFIDEIFKASSAILNSLLGIINERVFHCGRHRESVPLLGLIGASNEPPDPEGGLGALWDRFLVRLHVGPVEDATEFLRVALGEMPEARFTREQLITPDEIAGVRQASAGVAAPAPIRQALLAVRDGLIDAGIAASDRRFRQAVELLRVAAWTAGRDAIGASDLLLLAHCFGDPTTDEGTVRSVVRRALDQLVAPLISVDLAAAWRAVAGEGDDGASVGAAYAARFAALERFEATLAGAEQRLATARDATLAEAEASPWLTEVPARLIAAFVSVRRRLEAYRAAALRHRDELSGLDLHGALLQRLKLAQAGALNAVGLAPLRTHEIDPRSRERDAEIALWLVPPGEEPDHWIPLSTAGRLLFETAPLLAGRVQRRLLDRALSEGRPLDESVEWFRAVTTLELDEAAVFALGSEWPALQRFAGERGIMPGSPALAALRALSEQLRAAGMPRLPPLPEVDLPDASA